MNSKNGFTALMCIGLGLWVQAGGFIGVYSEVLDNTTSSKHLIYLGTILLIVGAGLSAKAKGRSALWGALGVFSIPGLIILACLKDCTTKTMK